jgi:predicted methyltransferase
VLEACHRATLGRHYDDPDAMIPVFEAGDRAAWQQPDRVVRSLALSDKHAIVAEIGAGSGYFTRRLAAEVPEGKVYAVDVDATFAEHLEKNREAWGLPNIEPHLAHYEDPMLPAGEVDVVFTANTYAYLRERTAYFRKVRAALRDGGRLAVIDFKPEAQVPGNAAPEAAFRVPRDTVVAELGAAGFKLAREETFLPHQYFLVFDRTP